MIVKPEILYAGDGWYIAKVEGQYMIAIPEDGRVWFFPLSNEKSLERMAVSLVVNFVKGEVLVFVLDFVKNEVKVYDLKKEEINSYKDDLFNLRITLKEIFSEIDSLGLKDNLNKTK